MSTQIVPETVQPQLLEDEINVIMKRIVLACREIPECLQDLNEDYFPHGDRCSKLQEDIRLRDRWVHGMFYEFRCLFRASGKAYLHLHPIQLPNVLDVLLILVSNKNPCHPRIDQVAEICRRDLLLTRDLPIREIDMWWKDLSNASFPVLSMNDYCDLLEHVQQAIDRTLETIDGLQMDAEAIFTKKTQTVETLSAADNL